MRPCSVDFSISELVESYFKHKAAHQNFSEPAAEEERAADFKISTEEDHCFSNRFVSAAIALEFSFPTSCRYVLLLGKFLKTPQLIKSLTGHEYSRTSIVTNTLASKVTGS